MGTQNINGTPVFRPSQNKAFSVQNKPAVENCFRSHGRKFHLAQVELEHWNLFALEPHSGFFPLCRIFSSNKLCVDFALFWVAFIFNRSLAIR